MSMTVTRLGETLVVVDRRDPVDREHRLTGELARLFDATHAGPTIPQLSARTGLSRDRVVALVDELASVRLVLRVDGHVLALAARPRDELVLDLLRKGG